MDNNTYQKIVLTIILLLIVTGGIMIINGIDRNRIRIENLTENFLKISNKIQTVKKEINSANFAENDIRLSEQSGTDSAQKKKTAKFANSEFYDQNADFGGRIINVQASETKNMNYIINNESFVGGIWNYTFDSLAARNYQNIDKFEPQLAESWEISEDKKTYTIKLKKGVLWHDFTDPVSGEKFKNLEVTAEDFKFYLDVIKNPDVDCAPIRGYFKDLEKIEVISDYEFKAHWNKKYFLSEIITLGLSPLPEHFYHAYEGDFNGKKFNDDYERNRMIVGCGPYRFSEWEKGQNVVLEKWDKYYGKEYGAEPAIDKIEFEIIKKENTRLQALVARQADRMSLSPEFWKTRIDTEVFAKDKGYIDKFKYPGRMYTYIGYNQKDPLFKNKNVRRALTHLINRKKILEDVYYNLGRIITGPFFIDSPYYDKNIKPYEFSVKKAENLLSSEGWKDSDGDGILDKNGKQFKFTILQAAGSSIQPKMLPLIKEDMAKAGILVNLQKVEWSVYTEKLEKKDFDACCLGWGLSIESDPYQLWHSSHADRKGSSNHISFKNKEADELIEKIRITFDRKKRIELCREFHKLIHEEQPYTFLISPYNLLIQNNRYENVKIFPIGVPEKTIWVPENKQLYKMGL